MIRALAPAKIFIAGEYAVLAGGTALVTAVNRYAEVRLYPKSTGWSFLSSGFEDYSEYESLNNDALTTELNISDPARMVVALKRARAIKTLPKGAKLELDTTSFYRGSTKFGIGSSSATMVALAGALTTSPKNVSLSTLHAAHQIFQGGVGSGADIATAYHGGMIAFKDNHIEQRYLANEVGMVFVFTGYSTNTGTMIKRFDKWRGDIVPSELRELIDSASILADCTEMYHQFLTQMAEYIEALGALDQAAQIGIYGKGHIAAKALAKESKVLYKPCGAGGGDMGIALSDDLDALQFFSKKARNKNLIIIPMERSQYGLQVHKS